MAKVHAFLRASQDVRVSAFASNDFPGEVLIATTTDRNDPGDFGYISTAEARRFAIDLLRASEEAEGGENDA